MECLKCKIINQPLEVVSQSLTKTNNLFSACRELDGNVQSTEYEKEEVEINLATLTKGILPGYQSIE